MKRIAPFVVLLVMLASMMAASPSSEVRAQTAEEAAAECAYFCTFRADRAEAEAINACRQISMITPGAMTDGDCVYFGATVWASVAMECYAGCF